MLFSAATAAAALLPVFALAAPVELDTRATNKNGPFSVMSVRSASPIHFGQMNANGQKFWINKAAETYCPASDCTGLNNATTVLSLSAASKATNGGLYDVVPGGQQIYVEKTGALGFTRPHSAAIPEGATLSGFVYNPPTKASPDYGHFTVKAFNSTGLIACPAETGAAYQVFADTKDFKLKDGCLGFDAFAIPYSGQPAWEYL